MANLWLPAGLPPLPRERGVVALSSDEMARMAGFHDVAQRHGFAVVCQRCDQALQGAIVGSDDVFSVACGCREYRAAMPAWMRTAS
jgi:hypothetical protein